MMSGERPLEGFRNRRIGGFLERLHLALNLSLPYPDLEQRRLPENFTSKSIPASVLVLFGFSAEPGKDGLFDPAILYLKRTETVEKHKGQMAFPGGHIDSEDRGDPDVTALRETEEEVGIPKSQIRLLGKLPALNTATGFEIQPVVGWIETPIREVVLNPDPFEVAEVSWIPFSILLDPATYRLEMFTPELPGFSSDPVPIHVYQVSRYRIWGATGSMTKNLIDRWRASNPRKF